MLYQLSHVRTTFDQNPGFRRDDNHTQPHDA